MLIDQYLHHSHGVWIVTCSALIQPQLIIFKWIRWKYLPTISIQVLTHWDWVMLICANKLVHHKLVCRLFPTKPPFELYTMNSEETCHNLWPLKLSSCGRVLWESRIHTRKILGVHCMVFRHRKSALNAWWCHQMEIFPCYWPFMRGIHPSPWIPLTKASDTELWCFLWSAPEQTIEKKIKTPVIWVAIALIMTSL